MLLLVPNDTECHQLSYANESWECNSKYRPQIFREFDLCHFDRTSVGDGQVASIVTRAALLRSHDVASIDI
jgi:hypothetical protein